MGIIGERHWNLYLVGGTIRRVWTRAQLDFVSDHSDETEVVGHFCEVPVRHRDWRERLTADETSGETPEDAVARFAEANGWVVERVEAA